MVQENTEGLHHCVLAIADWRESLFAIAHNHFFMAFELSVLKVARIGVGIYGDVSFN